MFACVFLRFLSMNLTFGYNSKVKKLTVQQSGDLTESNEGTAANVLRAGVTHLPGRLDTCQSC